MELERVLVGVDFSDWSALAVSSALDIAGREGAELILLHVIPESSPPKLSEADPTEVYGRQSGGSLPSAETRRRLEELRRRLSGQGAAVTALIAEGSPYEAIQSKAFELEADLIVVGHRGLEGFERLRVGSVAERVMRIAPASVLVARGGSPGRVGYRRVLVPVDLSERSAPAVEAAITLAAKDARIEVFHSYEIPAGARLPSYRRAFEEGAAELGAELVRPLSELHAGLSFHVEEGRAARRILERLEGGEYDLVVLGSHGRRGLSRFLLGSVAESVVRHAPCSALVVREQEARRLRAVAER